MHEMRHLFNSGCGTAIWSSLPPLSLVDPNKERQIATDLVGHSWKTIGGCADFPSICPSHRARSVALGDPVRRAELEQVARAAASKVPGFERNPFHLTRKLSTCDVGPAMGVIAGPKKRRHDWSSLVPVEATHHAFAKTAFITTVWTGPALPISVSRALMKNSRPLS